MEYKKKWKDLSFDEKVGFVESQKQYGGSTWRKRGEIEKVELRKRRDKRLVVATLLEMRGWVDVYDALTILELSDTRENHLKLAYLVKRHNLQKHLLGKINFFKKSEMINLIDDKENNS